LCLFFSDFGCNVSDLNHVTVDELFLFYRWENGRQIYQVILVCFFWFRLIFYMRVSEYSGVLGVIIVRMLSDVSHFVALVAILLLGYTFLFIQFFSTDQDSFESFVSTGWTLVFSSLGGFNYFEAPTEGGGLKLFIGNFLLFSYMCLSSIILVNLLIAMMGRTYSETFDESALGVWRLQFAHLVRQYSFDIFPPPLNLLWWVVRMISYTFTLVLHLLCKIPGSIVTTIKDGWIGEFIATICGDDLRKEFIEIDKKNPENFFLALL